MRDITLQFNKSCDKRPPVSGRYLAYTEYGSIITIDYSVVHGAWNCMDYEKDTSLKISYDDTYILAWAELSTIEIGLNDWRNNNE